MIVGCQYVDCWYFMDLPVLNKTISFRNGLLFLLVVAFDLH